MSIISEIKSNNLTAFRELYNEYLEKIYYYALGKTKSEYLSEEILQLTFVKFWKYRGSLKEDLPISTQLFRIASTTLIDIIRKQKNILAVVGEIERNNKNFVDNEANSKLTLEEINQILANTLKQMPPGQKQIFELNRFMGLTYSQIAEELSISVKTVESQISKSLKQLRISFSRNTYLLMLGWSIYLLMG